MLMENNNLCGRTIMKKFYIFAVFVVFIILISPINAADNTTDGNFSDLSDLIQNTSKGDTLYLNKDYKFDNLSDSNLKEGIELDFITIDGCNHVIDANGQSRIFKTFNNVTLNNIKLINGNADYGGAIDSNLTFACNNVTFENNYALNAGGAINTYFVELNNCIFDSNYAINGSSLNIKINNDIELELNNKINNSIFKNMKSNAIISYSIKEVFVEKCLFENITSEYGAALIGYIGHQYIINNTQFKNLHSSKSGGSILSFTTAMIIQNCDFINSSTVNNGGAVLIDYYAGHNFIENLGGTTEFINCNFVNCSAKYGGAFIQTGGYSSVINSTFNNNSADYAGGAIYTSLLTRANITNTSFTNNKANHNQKNSQNGGAICTTYNPISINNTKFINNTNNAIYSYECQLNLTNCFFENNIEALHHYYPQSNKLINNTYNNDKLIENDLNKDYNLIVSNSAIKLTLINNTIDVENLPSRFDVRDWGWDTKVGDQTFTSGCWAFATISAFESNIRKATGFEYNASTRNMHRTMTAFSEYGNLNPDGVNDTGTPVNYLVSWLGPIPEIYDPLDNFAKIDNLYFLNESIHVQDVMITRGRDYNLSNTDIKKLIITYGEISTSYGLSNGPPDLNINTSASYSQKRSHGTHAMVIVGWDDNYPASNFYITPPGDGAWIYKNSYGTNKKGNDKGYVYVSYYDVDFFSENENYIVLFDNQEDYTRNYQTDLGGELHIKNSTKTYSYKNSYTAIENELISGVGTYFNDKNEKYNLEIYVNNQLKLTQDGLAPFYGYHTIKLNENIPIKTNDNFTVIIKTNSVPLIEKSRIHFKENVSFVNYGDGWIDLAKESKTVTLKVYTKNLSIYTQDLVKIYKNASQFKADVGIVNASVIFELNGVNYTRLSDENGTAIMNINLNPGNYTIKTIFNGTTVENSIQVLPTLIANNLVKYFKNESQFDISLIDGEGNAVPNATITMNINGVFYNRTTNENGTSKLNINLNPGTYILTATDPLTGLMMSYNITVLPVLTAEDLKMTYLDGSQFKAKLVDGQGNPINNEKVTFNVNGVFYTRTTNSSGIACLNIRLMPGEYIITTSYENGATIGNKITISAKED